MIRWVGVFKLKKYGHLRLYLQPINKQRGVRVVEGARLESV